MECQHFLRSRLLAYSHVYLVHTHAGFRLLLLVVWWLECVHLYGVWCWLFALYGITLHIKFNLPLSLSLSHSYAHRCFLIAAHCASFTCFIQMVRCVLLAAIAHISSMKRTTTLQYRIQFYLFSSMYASVLSNTDRKYAAYTAKQRIQTQMNLRYFVPIALHQSLALRHIFFVCSCSLHYSVAFVTAFEAYLYGTLDLPVHIALHSLA